MKSVLRREGANVMKKGNTEPRSGDFLSWF